MALGETDATMSRAASRRRRRRRSRRDWRRAIARALAQLLFGLVLVGCASTHFNPRTLKITQDPPPLEVLKTVKETDPRLRAYRKLAHANHFAGTDRKLALDLLTVGLRDEKNELARSAAASALASYQEPQAVGALVRAASDPSDMVRADVCRALGKIKSPDAVETLGRMAIHDASLDVRVHATLALSQIDVPKASAYLVEAVKDKDIAVSRAGRNGLKTRYSIDLGTDPKAWARYVADHGGPEAGMIAGAQEAAGAPKTVDAAKKTLR